MLTSFSDVFIIKWNTSFLNLRFVPLQIHCDIQVVMHVCKWLTEAYWNIFHSIYILKSHLFFFSKVSVYLHYMLWNIMFYVSRQQSNIHLKEEAFADKRHYGYSKNYPNRWWRNFSFFLFYYYDFIIAEKSYHYCRSASLSVCVCVCLHSELPPLGINIHGASRACQSP